MHDRKQPHFVGGCMKKICIPLADGFEEIEAVTLIDVLRRAGFSVKTCGLNGLQTHGSHNITVIADMTIDQAFDDAWDLVVLPGGMPGASNLRDDARVGSLLKKTATCGGYVGAICAAPIALAHFGLVKGIKATSYPGFSEQMPDALYSEDRVVYDRKVLTSRGPGTAMEFALFIIETLADRSKAEELKKQMLLR
jgi:4-methyl-5(b-hydroxyethyl)-thiazole monophosphate biosynthesis